MPPFRPISAEEQRARAEAPLPEIELLPEVAFKRISAAAEEQQERMLKHWVAYVGKLLPTAEPVPATVLDHLTPPPSQQHLFGFAGYLAKNTRGLLDTWPTHKTIQCYLWSFYGMWYRRTGRHIPTATKLQTTTWLSDARFLADHPLSTKMREKPVASHADIGVLTPVLWRDPYIIALPHERAQLIYGVLLMAISSARPGEIVVSSKHHLGQCLRWKDHRLFMRPTQNPHRPDIYVHVTMEWLKGMRDDESKNRSLVLKCDPSNLANCPVFLLICCAVADGVLLDYETGASLFQPTYPVTEMREIRLDPLKAKLAVLRKVVSTNGHSVMTMEPMMSARFRYVVKAGSLKAGFKRHMPLYASRRNVAGKADSLASEAVRKLCMAHSPHSEVYESSYQSKLVPVDMQHLVSGEGEIDVRGIEAAQSMSAGRDEAAPRAITGPILAKLEQIPAVAAAADALERAMEEAERQPLDLPEDPLLVAKIQELRRKYRNIRNVESRWLIKDEREMFFEDKARRQAVGESLPDLRFANPDWFASRQAPINVALMVEAGEALDTSQLLAPNPPTTEEVYLQAVTAAEPYAGLSPLRLPPVVNAASSFLHYIFSAPGSDIHEQRLRACELFALLPDQPTRQFYPNEGAGDDGNCITCLKPFPTTKPALHAHPCAFQAQKTAADKALDDFYPQRACLWKGCSHVSSSALDLVAHVSRMHNGRCQWRLGDGTTCGKINAAAGSHRHTHGLCPSKGAFVVYCYFCHEW